MEEQEGAYINDSNNSEEEEPSLAVETALSLSHALANLPSLSIQKIASARLLLQSHLKDRLLPPHLVATTILLLKEAYPDLPDAFLAHDNLSAACTTPPAKFRTRTVIVLLALGCVVRTAGCLHHAPRYYLPSVSQPIFTHTHTHTHTPHTQRNVPTNKQAFVEVLLDLFSLTRPPPPSGDVAKVARAIQKAWNDASPHANLVRRISSLFKDCLTKHGYTKEKTQWGILDKRLDDL